MHIAYKIVTRSQVQGNEFKGCTASLIRCVSVSNCLCLCGPASVAVSVLTLDVPLYVYGTCQCLDLSLWPTVSELLSVSSLSLSLSLVTLTPSLCAHLGESASKVRLLHALARVRHQKAINVIVAVAQPLAHFLQLGWRAFVYRSGEDMSELGLGLA